MQTLDRVRIEFDAILLMASVLGIILIVQKDQEIQTMGIMEIESNFDSDNDREQDALIQTFCNSGIMIVGITGLCIRGHILSLRSDDVTSGVGASDANGATAWKFCKISNLGNHVTVLLDNSKAGV
jgi:hypothetical protein